MSSPADVRDWRGVPASEIAPKHWQSGLPLPFVELPRHGIDLVVLSAKEVQPGAEEVRFVKTKCPDLRIITAPLDDVECEESLTDIARVAGEVADRLARRIGEGRTVLVTCQVGRNRSGLISALTLMRRYPDLTGEQAARRVRRQRGQHLPPGEQALSNRVFYDYLCSLPAGAGAR